MWTLTSDPSITRSGATPGMSCRGWTGRGQNRGGVAAGPRPGTLTVLAGRGRHGAVASSASLDHVQGDIDDHVFLAADHLAAPQFDQDSPRVEAVFRGSFLGVAQEA